MYAGLPVGGDHSALVCARLRCCSRVVLGCVVSSLNRFAWLGWVVVLIRWIALAGCSSRAHYCVAWPGLLYPSSSPLHVFFSFAFPVMGSAWLAWAAWFCFADAWGVVSCRSFAFVCSAVGVDGFGMGILPLHRWVGWVD